MGGHFSQFIASRRSTSFVRTGLLYGDREALGADAYIEIVSYLYASAWPLVIVGFGYVALSVIAFDESGGDPFFAVLGSLGALIAMVRVWLVFSYRSQPVAQRRHKDAVEWERRYLVGGFLFSICLGLLEAKLFINAHAVEPFGIALLYAYGAGLAARVCMRPRIAIGSLILVGVTAIGGMIARGSIADLCLAAFTAVFMFGAFETIFHIYKSIVASVTLRYEFAALARHDELTGLPNRLLIRERLSHEVTRLARHGGLVAIHYLDLDHFKMANDKFGHPTGDVLLRHVAERLQRLLRMDDVVGRLGGDEFLIVQTGIIHQGEAEVLAMRMIRALNQPFDIGGKEIVIGASVGIALAPTDATDISTLIKLADAALYEAKARGRSRYAFHKDRREMASMECEAASAETPQSASA